MISEKRYYNLDIIKMISSILIVFHHYQQLSGITFDGINFYGGKFLFGYLVELFFMISGFVTIVVYKEGSNHQLKQFLHKCIRIYLVLESNGYLRRFVSSFDYCSILLDV